MKSSMSLLAMFGAVALAFSSPSGSALADGSLKDAPADESRKLNWTWTVTGASDYMFRGISFTQNDPTVNSYLEFTYGIAYLGLWTSNIDTWPDTGLGPWEQDIYLGIRPVTGPINWDIAALWYIYGNKAKGADGSVWDTDYVELKVGATTSPITNFTVGATVYYTLDQDLASPQNVSAEGSVAYALPKIGIFDPIVSGLVGFSDASANGRYPTAAFWNGDDRYIYWNAGVKLVVEKFFMDLRYWDTNNSDPNNTGFADGRFVFSAGVALP